VTFLLGALELAALFACIAWIALMLWAWIQVRPIIRQVRHSAERAADPWEAPEVEADESSEPLPPLNWRRCIDPDCSVQEFTVVDPGDMTCRKCGSIGLVLTPNDDAF
jgi:flagellar biosynthesis/type III secretory pathway M-ring protein FliF/YscJ